MASLDTGGMGSPVKSASSMKVVRKDGNGETRELLLKEYFLNAYLIALLKRAGEEAGRFADRGSGLQVPVPVPVR